MGLFGTYSERQVKKINKIARAVDALSEKYKNMTNEELRAVTAELKARLADGETLDDILPDAFAAVREADDRVLGKRPFFVQIIGGILLHQGRIAEMKTGEGKTLVATMPAYLNALTEKGVHIVTVNDYLARRDSEEMGRVYEFLGLRTGLVVHKGQKANTYLTYYVSADNVNWTQLTDKHVASTEEIRTTISQTPNTTDYYLVEERLTNLPKGTQYLKVQITTPTAWQPGLDFIYVYDLAEAPHVHTFGEWLYNPIKHTVEKFCKDDNTYYVKGNVADVDDEVLDIYDIVMMNEIAGGAEFNGEADVLDGDGSGTFDLADLTWLRKFILRKIYG